MLQMEHSAILLTFIKLTFEIFVLSNFEWPFYTDFTVFTILQKTDTSQLNTILLLLILNVT